MTQASLFSTRSYNNQSLFSDHYLDDILRREKVWQESMTESFTGFVRELAGSVRGLSKLVDVYQDHAGEYGRLAHQITTTDHLIDQIVFRLYGLTPEEIDIVLGT